jgi:Mg-chelatase subunit ChlD
MRKLLMIFLLTTSLSILTSCDDIIESLTSSFPSIGEIKVHSLVPSSDFAETGKAKLYLSFLDEDGTGIIKSVSADKINEMIDLKVVATKSDGTEVEGKSKDPNVKKPSDLPSSFALNIDSSGSMSSTDGERQRVDAAKKFVDTVLESNSSNTMGIFDFGNGSTDNFTDTNLLQNFTSDATLLKAAIDKVEASGGTPLFDSLTELLDYYNTNVNNSEYQRAIVLLTDGVASDTLKEEVINKASEYKIPVNVLGFSSGDNQDMRDLANDTEGIYTVVESAEDLETAFDSIAVGNEAGYAIYEIEFPPGELNEGEETDCTVAATVGGSTTEAETSITP